MDIKTMYGALPEESQKDFIDFMRVTRSTLLSKVVLGPQNNISFQFIADSTFTGVVRGAGVVNLAIGGNPAWNLTGKPNCQMWIPATVYGEADMSYSYISLHAEHGYINSSLVFPDKSWLPSPVGCTLTPTDPEHVRIDIFDLPKTS